jgi:hypothetical protein
MALGSLVDKPLIQNPLAGGGLGSQIIPNPGSGLADGITPRGGAPETALPEVYTNPVTKEILDGYRQSDFFTMSPQQDVATIEINGLPYTSNGAGVGALREYMKSIGKENMITGNGGLLQPLDTSSYFTNYGGGNVGPNITEGGTPALIDPGAEARRKADEEFLKTADEYQRGFRESEFYKPNAPMTADMAEFIYKSPTGEDITMKGSSSGIGQFGSYLDSIGKGDLLQSVSGVMSAQTPGLQDLAKVEPESSNPFTPPTPTIPKLDGTRSVSPIYSGDNSIATTQTANPYQEQFTGFGDQLTGFGDQLTGFGDQFGGLDKQFNTINTRLDNVDEGIASLSEQLQPQQQLYNSPYSNFNFSSNSYSNPSPFGLGSLFMRRY